jgi:hypothetical protein
MDEITRRGLNSLANKLYQLRCDLKLCASGEVMLPAERAAAMQVRIAELQPLVDGYLDAMLAADDA